MSERRHTCARIRGIKVTLLELGWSADLQCTFKKLSRQDFVPARVSSLMKGHFGVWGESGDGLTRLSGKLLFRAKSNSDLPAVGDWVAIDREAGNNRGVIHHVLPRRSKISRKIAGPSGRRTSHRNEHRYHVYRLRAESGI
jgi:ribosome biogenesis GTPase